MLTYQISRFRIKPDVLNNNTLNQLSYWKTHKKSTCEYNLCSPEKLWTMNSSVMELKIVIWSLGDIWDGGRSETETRTLIKMEKLKKKCEKLLGHATDLIGKLMLNNFVIYMIMERKKMKSRSKSSHNILQHSVWPQWIRLRMATSRQKICTQYLSNKSSNLAEFTINLVCFRLFSTIFMTYTWKQKSPA